MALLGGSGGFIGVGVIGRTAASDDGSSRKVMFCIPCNESRLTSNDTSKSSSTDSGRKVSDGPGLPFAFNPHTKESVIQCFAVGRSNNIFVAADNLGVLSIWYLDKNNSPSRYAENPARHSKRMMEDMSRNCRPEYQSSTTLNSMGSSGNHKGQRVIKMHFLPNDTHLVVCTNKRLLLLELNSPPVQSHAPAKSFTDLRQSISEDISLITGSSSSINSNTGSNSPVGFGTFSGSTGVAPIRVTGWVELDRVALGCSGVFGMHVEEASVVAEGVADQENSQANKFAVAAPAGQIIKGEKFDDIQVPDSTHSSTTGAEAVPPMVVPALQRIVQWKLTEDEDMTNLKPKSGKAAKTKPLSKCTLYRFEWSDQMFRAALQKMKFV
jgi:hypothetical protein